MLEKVILGQRPGRPGRHVLDGHAGRERHRIGQVAPVPACMHSDLMASLGEGHGERGDVHVLAASVGTAQHGQRAGVL